MMINSTNNPYTCDICKNVFTSPYVVIFDPVVSKIIRKCANSCFLYVKEPIPTPKTRVWKDVPVKLLPPSIHPRMCNVCKCNAENPHMTLWDSCSNDRITTCSKACFRMYRESRLKKIDETEGELEFRFRFRTEIKEEFERITIKIKFDQVQKQTITIEK